MRSSLLKVCSQSSGRPWMMRKSLKLLPCHILFVESEKLDEFVDASAPGGVLAVSETRLEGTFRVQYSR
jgi:hypothetical protein